MKKILCMILALVMLLSLAACGAKTETNAPAAENAPTAEKAPASEAAPSEELDFVTIKFIALGDAGPNEDAVVAAINEKLKADLNCELEVEWISWSDWETTYSLIFASGESYDLVYTSNWASYFANATKGAFHELTREDIAKYMPLTNAVVTDDQWGAASVDGKIYCIPQTATGFYDDDTCWVVRGDIMDKIGLESIETTDDILAYFDGVLAEYPDMVPINEGAADSGKQAMHLIQNFVEQPYPYWEGYFPCLGYSGGAMEIRNLPIAIDFSDPSNVKLCDQAGVDEYYLTLFKLAKEFKDKGYWSSDALTISDCDYDSFNVGKGASFNKFLSQSYQFAANANNTNPDWDCRVYRVTDQPLLQQSPLNNAMAINATTKNFERSMMVMDLLGYDQSYYDLMYYGFEGTHYTLDGEAVTNDGSFGGTAISMGFVTTCMRSEAGENPDYTALKNSASCLPIQCQVVFDTTNVATEVAMTTQITAKYLPILALGMSDDVEATYAQFKAELEAAGQQTIVDEYISQVQAQLNANG